MTGELDDMLSTGDGAANPPAAPHEPPVPDELKNAPVSVPNAPRMTVGRIVHYYSDTTHEGTSGPFAALVTAVRENGNLMLHVYAERNRFDVDNVPFNGDGRHWEIPPRV